RVIMCFFFFSSRRRHTRCYRDWSSDVCSSDLEQALTPVVKEAMDAGIKVVTLDRKVNTPVTVHVGGDNLPLGVGAGEFLAKKLNGKGKIIELQGTAGASATIDRNKGFAEAIAKHPDMKVVASQNCDYTRDKAVKFMEHLVQR